MISNISNGDEAWRVLSREKKTVKPTLEMEQRAIEIMEKFSSEIESNEKNDLDFAKLVGLP